MSIKKTSGGYYDNYGNRRSSGDYRKDQFKRGAAGAGAAWSIGTSMYGATKPPYSGSRPTGNLSSSMANNRRNEVRAKTTRPRYTIGDAIMGKKPPKSKWF